MKILYLSQRLPFPPDRGDRIVVYNHLRHLSRTHKLYAASPADPAIARTGNPEFPGGGVGLATAAHSGVNSSLGILRAFRLGQPLTLGFYWNSKLMSSISRIVDSWQPDVAIAFSSSMAQYLEPFDHLARIIHFCDLDSQKWADLATRSSGFKRLVFQREARLLLKYERRIANCFSASCVVTQHEAELFRSLIPDRPVCVIENGVDSGYFQAIPRKTGSVEFTFVGVMDYPPNIEAVVFFAKDVWPLIRRELPNANFTVVGSRPTKDVLKLGNIPGVAVTGPVPDVRPYLAKSSLVVVPLAIARGIQNKVLEAMAAGIPVLASPVAAAGLPQDGRVLINIVERDAEMFAALAVQIIRNRECAEQKARAAKRFVARHYSWEEKVRNFESLLLSVAQANAA
jgi:polysaccharide biosynthesis protein PslH